LFENGGVHVYAVRELSAYLKELLETSPVLGDLWVAGEVSNANRPASGHVYFTLKDPQAQIRCVFFSQRFNPRSRTANLVENGTALLAHGRVSLFERRGDLQFYVDFVQLEGAGALQAEFERLKEQLGADGLFDESRKRPLPAIPRRIGVVTSPTGAVFHDICHVLERRWPLAEVVLAPTPVQGPDAVPGVVGGINSLNDLGDVDVIIVARGGGSLEELWAFNDERVARAIFASRVPVVSAVGHETDYTIADYVADQRAPTPSAAAEVVAPDRIEMSSRLGIAAGTMGAVLRQRILRYRAAIQRGTSILGRGAPDIDASRRRIDAVMQRTTALVERRHGDARQHVGNCVWRLRALDPDATLQRGYAIVQGRRGIVSSVGGMQPGEALQVRVKDGSFDAIAGKGAPIRRPRRRAVPEEQTALFSMPEDRA
jgi:exodeoxyribonuclease VII large subunit